jgi:hypothetical protein
MNHLKTHVIRLRGRVLAGGAAALLACALSSAAALAQREVQGTAPTGAQEPRLPDGRSQKEEILKHEYKKALEEAGELLKLAEGLKADLERDDRHVLSVQTLRRTEDIEKLAKRIRGRLKRY